MHTYLEYIKTCFDKIRMLTFLQRLFSWKRVQDTLVEAYASIGKLQMESDNMQREKNACSNDLSASIKDVQLLNDQKIRLEEQVKSHQTIVTNKDHEIQVLKDQLTEARTNCNNLDKQIQSLTIDIAASKENLNYVQQNLKDASDKCITLVNNEEIRKNEHSNSLATLKLISERTQAERDEEKRMVYETELARLNKMKETWSNHESSVKSCIRNICNVHTIEYVEKVPFKGEPDNCIKICGEYIIFDSKSPAGEDLSNFYNYIKDQAEKAKKYAKQENVKPDIFLVVPANTAAYIKQTSFYLGDFTVYVIYADSLEPLILSLKKIENYEFAEQLSPEERENICRVLGKFAHLTKRRIQIDSFFARQFMEIVYKCESTLPADFLKDVAAFERSEKLNPPLEKRSKAINSKELENEVLQVQNDITGRGISLEDMSTGINEIKLYREE